MIPAIGLLCLAATATAENLSDLDCVIEPHEVIDLASRVDGIVDTIDVERGDLVEAGQVLIKLDSGVETAAVAAAQARANASAEIEANNVSAEFAKRRHDRLQAMFREAAISSDQMDEITTETDLTLLQLQRAWEARGIAELELAQSKEILHRHTIRSPVDGVVVQRYLASGESTEDQPILRVAQIDPLRVEVIVPVSAFGTLELGQTATVFPEAPKEGAFPAVVTVVDRVADAASGTFRVRLSMPNPDYAVPSGLNCRVRFMPIKSAPKTRIASATNAAVVRRVTAEQQAAPHCGTIGPFQSEADADRISTALDGRVERITKSVKQRKVGNSIMLISERQDSVAAAMALADEMKTAGVTDLFVFAQGEAAGLISLGIYSSRDAAKRRQGALRELDFETELQIQSKTRADYWLDVELRAELDPDALDTHPALAEVSITPASCEKIVAQSN